MDKQAELFAKGLNEIADGPMVGGFSSLTEKLMRMMCERGFTIKQLSGPLMMDRSVSTLQARAREFGLSFPDYVPMEKRETLDFKRKGDFYECQTESADLINDLLGFAKRGNIVSIPAHACGGCKKDLKDNFYRTKGLPNG